MKKKDLITSHQSLVEDQKKIQKQIETLQQQINSMNEDSGDEQDSQNANKQQSTQSLNPTVDNEQIGKVIADAFKVAMQEQLTDSTVNQKSVKRSGDESLVN